MPAAMYVTKLGTILILECKQHDRERSQMIRKALTMEKKKRLANPETRIDLEFSLMNLSGL